ncbi:MAG: aminoacyl-tRNA hydrolase [Deltaproteobacteria bacterium]|nr:aminoacyl-tRNA hydrolase [Deltaproteobacteria bacterium]
MKLVVGLGNPGEKYIATRHNAGFMVVDALAKRYDIGIDKVKNKSLTGKGIIAGDQVIIAKPQTFMNLSGEAVKPLFSYIDINAEDVIVIHDDLDLDFGRIKIKSGGGHGGHNGIRSIISHLGKKDFIRVRVGIGKPPPRWNVSNYVLSPFAADEREELHHILEKSADAAEAIIADGSLTAMNRFN